MTANPTPTPFLLAWATDTHFDHTINEPWLLTGFVNSIQRQGAQGLLLTGDISSGVFIRDHLVALQKGLGPDFPIWYILGNHDYYNNGIQDVRQQLKDLETAMPNLRHLNNLPFVSLNTTTALVGHDGWYDALYSDIRKSRLMMNDFLIIRELKSLHSLNVYSVKHELNGKLHKKLQELAKEGAKHVEDGARAAIVAGHTKIVIGTHIPPFPQNSLYNGKQSDGDWLPFFSSKLMGDAILRLADGNPQVSFEVFCGHSHGKAHFTAGKTNLTCITGEAHYGLPKVDSFLEF